MSDIVALSETEYALLVAPPMKVTAHLAAERGHRQLFDDLPAMLILMHLVRGLTEWYWVTPRAENTRSSWATLSLAPLGACSMAIALADMDEETRLTCLKALQAGHELLSMDGVLPSPTILTETAWHALQMQDHDAMDTALRDAGLLGLQAIESWEARRAQAPEREH